MIEIRAYKSSDCEQMAKLFYDTVHTINTEDYTEEQVNAWAPEKLDLAVWNESFLEHYTVVAVQDGRIVGFGDIAQTGYLDRLFVHRDHQRNGIGFAICNELERAIQCGSIETHASITARPFFEKRGYRVIREQIVKKRGIFLKNYVMRKSVQL